MQEEVDEKTVALVINGGKISGRILKAALEKMVRGIEEKRRLTGSETEARKKEIAASKAAQKEVKKANKPGRRTLKSMMESGSELSNIEITDNNIRSFEKVARKYRIQYSLKKDKSKEPPQYLVFFRAKDEAVMTAAFKEYTGMALPATRKASIRKRLQKAIARSAKHREREKTRQKEREPSHRKSGGPVKREGFRRRIGNLNKKPAGRKKKENVLAKYSGKVLADITGRLQMMDMKKTMTGAIPYLIVFYLIEKEAWLYRHCTGNTMIQKLMNLVMYFGLAFRNPVPSPFWWDVVVGIIGAVSFWAFIRYRRKNAKKYRQGVEYGSARWGTAKCALY